MKITIVVIQTPISSVPISILRSNMKAIQPHDQSSNLEHQWILKNFHERKSYLLTDDTLVGTKT